jgi:hypothetical protein
MQKQCFINTGVVLAACQRLGLYENLLTLRSFSVRKASYECLPYKSSTGAVDGELGVLGDREAFC